MRVPRQLATLVIASTMLAQSAGAPARVAPLFEDQVADRVIPRGAFEAAAATWGVRLVYGGPPAAKRFPGRRQGDLWPSPRSWLGEWLIDGQGIIDQLPPGRSAGLERCRRLSP